MAVFKFTVTVETEREEGKFVANDKLRDEIREALEDADPGALDVDESTYNVVAWEVGDA